MGLQLPRKLCDPGSLSNGRFGMAQAVLLNRSRSMGLLLCAVSDYCLERREGTLREASRAGAVRGPRLGTLGVYPHHTAVAISREAQQKDDECYQGKDGMAL